MTEEKLEETENKEPECPSSPEGYCEPQTADVNSVHACKHCGRVL